MAIIYEPRGKAAEYSPLAANIYRGCSHGCVYCYAPSATYRERSVFHGHPEPRRNFMEELKRDLKKYRGDERPVLLCFTTDPYQQIDESARLARYTIKALANNGNRVRILTKGGTRAARDFDVMGSCNCEFGATLTFFDEEQSIKWEPGAAAPDDRIAALKAAHKQGIRTWVSLEPAIDPNEVYKIINATHEFVDLYKVGKLNYHPLSKTIDWHDFRVNVESLLSSLEKDFYIKDDLRKF